MARSRTTFKPGQRAAVGNRGPGPRHAICTQVLVSQLNEIDNTTGREKIHRLMDTLYKLAVGYTRKRRVISVDKETGVAKEVVLSEDVPPDVTAIKEVIDRVQGKSPVSLDINSSPPDETIYRGEKEIAEELIRRGMPRSLLGLVIEGEFEEVDALPGS